MTNDEKNKTDSKGYTPVQLIVMKTLRHSNYLHLAKVIAYNDSVNLECRNPSGWTPLQEALIHVRCFLLREIYHCRLTFLELFT